MAYFLLIYLSTLCQTESGAVTRPAWLSGPTVLYGMYFRTVL